MSTRTVRVTTSNAASTRRTRDVVVFDLSSHESWRIGWHAESVISPLRPAYATPVDAAIARAIEDAPWSFVVEAFEVPS